MCLSWTNVSYLCVQASRVLSNMKGLQGGTLFLAHGTADGTSTLTSPQSVCVEVSLKRPVCLHSQRPLRALGRAHQTLDKDRSQLHHAGKTSLSIRMSHPVVCPMNVPSANMEQGVYDMYCSEPPGGDQDALGAVIYLYTSSVLCCVVKTFSHSHDFHFTSGLKFLFNSKSMSSSPRS